MSAAVDLAKQCHKDTGTEESEAVLKEAYTARILEILDKGHAFEAKSLLDLVWERYHWPDHAFAEINAVICARCGNIDDLVAPLNDPSTSKETRAAVEKIIKRDLTDLYALAGSNALPPDHPLKIEAQAAARAFGAVTAGPVDDEALALSGIPRKSPLAPWKMLIRALAGFYRYDDVQCERYLEAVDPASAPSRLAPVIRAMVSGKIDPELGKDALRLIGQISGSEKNIRRTFQVLERALASKKHKELPRAVSDALDACQAYCPDLAERLKQHISIRSWMIEADPRQIEKAMGGPSTKNAYFWKLHARAAEAKNQWLFACALWDEFIRHALHEGRDYADGKALSAIYLHMANLLQEIPASDFAWRRLQFMNKYKGFGHYYSGQPPSVSAAARKDEDKDTYFLYPERLYRLACEADPSSETFGQWLEWTGKTRHGWKESEKVALAWHEAIPDDVKPLLSLAIWAEKRNALKKALEHLEKAERIDGLNSDVKRAGRRLLAAIAVRHLRQGKPHLVKKDLAEMEALPQFGEGDRPAFIVALRYACAMIEGNLSEHLGLKNDLIGRTGSSACAILILEGVCRICGLPAKASTPSSEEGDPLKGHDLAAAVARGCSLGDDMGLHFTIPPAYEAKIGEFLVTNGASLDASMIRVIAEAALRNNNTGLAYAASGAGLLKGGADCARFLLLRARSLPYWERDRKNKCIGAAIELGRRNRDMDVLNDAIELRNNGSGSTGFFSIRGAGKWDMDPEEVNGVLRQEKEAPEYPVRPVGSEIEDLDECRQCNVEDCPNRKAPYMPEYDDWDGDDWDDDEYSGDLFDDEMDDLMDPASGIPPQALLLLQEMMLKHGGKDGELPDPEELLRKDPKSAMRLLQILLEAETGGVPSDFDFGRLPGFGSRKRKSGRKRKKRK